MNPPNNILLSYNVYPKGTFEVGYESCNGGMTVGTSIIIGRIQIPEDCGSYPDGWFPIHGSITKIKKDIESESLSNGAHIIPKSILLDCYSYHWEVLKREKDLR